MNIYLTFLFLILFVFPCSSISAQERQQVTVVKNDGTTLLFSTMTQRYNGQHILPNTGRKKFIRGYIKDKKIKIPKSEIQKIKMNNGKEYFILKETITEYTNSYYKYHIGMYATKGKINVFITYTYDRVQTSTGFNPNGLQNYALSTNKIVFPVMYKAVGKQLFELTGGIRKEMKNLGKECPEFKTYVENYRINNNSSCTKLVKAFRFYNSTCE